MTKKQGQETAKEIKAKAYYETSAKEGEGIDELFDDIAQNIFEQKKAEAGKVK